MFYNKNIETLSIDELRALQSSRLVDLVHRLYQDVPHYKKAFDQQGLQAQDIKSIEDISKLPFTNKSDLRDHYPFGLTAVPQEDIRRIHASSGTTGKPTVVTYTQKDLETFDEVVARSLVCAGARPGMKLHNAYGYGLFTGGLGMHGGATKLGMSVIPVSGGMTERQLTILQDFEPEVICCTPSYAQTLAEQCKARGINPTKLKVKYAVLGAEPWSEPIRQHVEAGLQVSATNIYGLSEIIGPGVSQEDHEEKGSGSYIWEDHFFPEVIDPVTEEPLEYGQEGVLVFTTLTKEAFPLIRYKTNDICSIYYDSNSKRSHIKMSMIKGRQDDMLIIRGVNFYPTQLDAVIEQLDFLSPHYQIIIDRINNKDTVSAKIEVRDHSAIENAAYKNKLAHQIKDTIGLSFAVELTSPGSLPRSEGGKLKKVIDRRSLFD